MSDGSKDKKLVGGASSLDKWALASPIIPVITINRAEDAVPMARALVSGGLNMLEITLRTPFGLDAIRAIKQAIPDAIVGDTSSRRRTILGDCLRRNLFI